MSTPTCDFLTEVQAMEYFKNLLELVRLLLPLLPLFPILHSHTLTLPSSHRLRFPILSQAHHD